MASKFTKGWLERAMNGDYTGLDVEKPKPKPKVVRKKIKKKPPIERTKQLLKNRDKYINNAVKKAMGG